MQFFYLGIENYKIANRFLIYNQLYAYNSRHEMPFCPIRYEPGISAQLPERSLNKSQTNKSLAIESGI